MANEVIFNRKVQYSLWNILSHFSQLIKQCLQKAQVLKGLKFVIYLIFAQCHICSFPYKLDTNRCVSFVSAFCEIENINLHTYIEPKKYMLIKIGHFYRLRRKGVADNQLFIVR